MALGTEFLLFRKTPQPGITVISELCNILIIILFVVLIFYFLIMMFVDFYKDLKLSFYNLTYRPIFNVLIICRFWNIYN